MTNAAYHPFRSAAARDEYLALYERIAATWPVPNETRLIETTWGQTHVRISGPSDGPPLVLLPGAAVSALMWRANVAGLSGPLRTYALDHIYDSGRSVAARQPKNVADLTKWLDETLTALGLEDVSLLGLSAGGWLCAQFALAYPQRVRRMVLAAPAGITSSGLEFTLRFLGAFLRPKAFDSFITWLLADLLRQGEAGQQAAREFGEEMRLSARVFQPRAMVLPKVMKDEELRGLTMPALYLVGENDKSCYPAKAIARLKAVAPQVQTEIVPGVGHDITFVMGEALGKRVVEFVEGN